LESKGVSSFEVLIVSQAPDDLPSLKRFPTTDWSLVVAAGDPDAPRSKESLETLCGAYWYPIYAYIRHRGYPPESAQDLTQDFFTRVLEKGLFAEADPVRGRFRSFLRTVCTHYLANRRDRERAFKRGGGRSSLPIDSADAESRYTREPAHELTPDRIFDRSWALTLLTRVFDRLRREYEDAGRGNVIDELRAVLTEDPQAAPYSKIAARLGISEGAVRVAVHRLRRRYGILLRQEIGTTVDDPAEVDDEIRALFAALRT
jgi:RNA polymerase sigma factor (sigma-70 family)